MHKLQLHFDKISIVLIGFVTCLAFLSFSPYRVPDPHRDSGIFLSIGSEILRGKVLYQQAWDTKQPLIYFMNALGLWLGRGSVWGVWGLELFSLLSAFFTGYALLRRKLTPFASFFVVVISFLTVFPFFGGNYTEEYTLFFQVSILAVLFWFYLPAGRGHARSIAALTMGGLMGLNFSLKQNYLDVAISVFLLILFLAWLNQDRWIILHAVLIGLGFALVNLPFWIYFYLKGALNDYLTSAFLFNRYYVNIGLVEWLHALLEKIEFIASTPFLLVAGSIWLGSVFILFLRGRDLFQAALSSRLVRWAALALGLACWLLLGAAQMVGSSPGMGLFEWGLAALGAGAWAAAAFFFFRKPGPELHNSWSLERLRKASLQVDWQTPGAAPLLFLGIIDLPVAVLIISLSGRDFTHYYISLFPAVFLLFAGGLAYLYSVAARASNTLILNALLAAVLVMGAFGPALQMYTFLTHPGRGDARFVAAAYLKAATTPEDKILVWGWESVIYFLANREAPTRYGIQFAAYLDSPYRQAILNTILTDLQNTPPAYIADTLDEDMPLTGGRSGQDCLSGSQLEDPQLQSILAFVCSHYELDQVFENIRVYKLK